MDQHRRLWCMARWLRLTKARYWSIASALVHVVSDNSLIAEPGVMCCWTCTQCRTRNRTRFTRFAPQATMCSRCNERLQVHPCCSPEALAPEWMRARPAPLAPAAPEGAAAPAAGPSASAAGGIHGTGAPAPSAAAGDT